MHVFEIAVRKLESAPVAFRLLVVFTKVPLSIFGVAMLLCELLLRGPRRLVIAPVGSIVEHEAPVGDRLFGVVERTLVQLDRHVTSPFMPRTGRRQPSPSTPKATCGGAFSRRHRSLR